MNTDEHKKEITVLPTPGRAAQKYFANACPEKIVEDIANVLIRHPELIRLAEIITRQQHRTHNAIYMLNPCEIQNNEMTRRAISGSVMMGFLAGVMVGRQEVRDA